MNETFERMTDDGSLPLGNPARGCGKRRRGKCYLVTKLAKGGSPFEDFLCCPPRKVSPEEQRALGLTALGVKLVPFPQPDGTTVYHVFDIIGREHYKYPLDWVEEAMRYGISRLISVETDFAKLSERSLYVPLHACGFIENAEELHRAIEAAEQVMHPCPKNVHTLLDEEMCIRLWRHVFTKRETEERKGLMSTWRVRVMPSFEYDVELCPEGLAPEYSLAILGAFPISGLEVVKDPDGGTHEKAVEAVQAARANGIGVQLVDL